MPTRKKSNASVDRWNEIVRFLRGNIPHLWSALAAADDFIELRLKSRDDGTVLAIMKSYDADGGPVVCFGVGYDPVLALMAIDATIQGGHWRTDKPWKPGKG